MSHRKGPTLRFVVSSTEHFITSQVYPTCSSCKYPYMITVLYSLNKEDKSIILIICQLLGNNLQCTFT